MPPVHENRRTFDENAIKKARAIAKATGFHALADDLRLGGLAGTEPVAIYAKGSVGLDQTLDFVIDPEFSEAVMLEAPTTSTIANTILKTAGGLDRIRRLFGHHRLVGTLNKPEYRFELGPQEALKQVVPAPANIIQHGLQGIQGILDAVSSPQDSRN